jgi:hypothetical protein
MQNYKEIFQRELISRGLKVEDGLTSLIPTLYVVAAAILDDNEGKAMIAKDVAEQLRYVNFFNSAVNLPNILSHHDGSKQGVYSISLDEAIKKFYSFYDESINDKNCKRPVNNKMNILYREEGLLETYIKERIKIKEVKVAIFSF